MNSKRKYFQINKQFHCDVAVVGGGTTGLAAAIAAANNGVKTILIEKNGCLGGNSTAIPAWLGFHSCAGEPTVKGLPLELLHKLQTKGGATDFYPDPICGSVVGINTHWWKIVAAESVLEAGITTLLHCSVFELQKEDKEIKSLFVDGPDGVMEINAKHVIDCTDNGIIASLAGEQLIRGRDEDNQVQVSSWVFELDNIDFAELFKYFKEFPEDIRPFKLADPVKHLENIIDNAVFVMGAFSRLVDQARKDGMTLERDNMPGIAFPRQKKMVSVACRIADVDTQDSVSRSQSELTGAIQVEQWIKFLKKYVPGFKNCQLSASPMSLGNRETNHLKGQYVLTSKDLLEGKKFDDNIALGGYHLDVHSPDHLGLETQTPPLYSIPYRCLLPLVTDNLIMAGRVISATHEAQSSTRVVPISMAQGEAAGTAAAIAVQQNSKLPDIDVKYLQELLVKNNALISPVEKATRSSI